MKRYTVLCWHNTIIIVSEKHYSDVVNVFLPVNWVRQVNVFLPVDWVRQNCGGFPQGSPRETRTDPSMGKHHRTDAETR